MIHLPVLDLVSLVSSAMGQSVDLDVRDEIDEALIAEVWRIVMFIVSI